MDIRLLWKRSTQKIFWGMIVIAIAGIFSLAYDNLALFVGIMELAEKYIPSSLLGDLPMYLMTISLIGGVSKAAVIVGYVFYLWGLKQFARIQSDKRATANVLDVHTAVVILLCSAGASILFGFVIKLPIAGAVVNLVIWFTTWIAYEMMKNSFRELSISPTFSGRSQDGAKKLKTAAKCNIMLLLIPIFATLLVALVVVMAISSGSLTIIDNFIETSTGIVVFFGVWTLICMIIALVFPFIGWYQIMRGGPYMVDEE